MRLQAFETRASRWLVCFLLVCACPFGLPQIQGADEAKSDPSAVTFLKDAQSKIYNPVAEGLETLCFKRPFTNGTVEAGQETFWFKAPDHYAYTLEFNDTPEAEAVAQSYLLDEEQRSRRAIDTLNIYLGTFLIQDMEDYTYKFLEGREDTVTVRCNVKPTSPLKKYLSYRELIFDKEGMVQRMKNIDPAGMVQTFGVVMKELGESGLFVLDRIEIANEADETSLMSVQSFLRDEIDGFHLVNGTVIEIPMAQAKIDLPSEQIEVNQPIDDRVFAAPAKETEKAQAEDAAGGGS